MQQVQLHGSELRCSRLAYGCWRIISAGKAVEVTPDREGDARKAILAAVEAGYTLFDHADIYSDGLGEWVFGRVLRDNRALRDRVVLASKCGIRKAGDPNALSPYRYDFSAQHIIQSCEGSLKRLQTDRLDLYQLHRPDFLANPEEVAGAFSKLKEQGKARHFGLSNASPAFFSMIQKACPFKLLVNQIEISLLRLDFFRNGTLEQCLMEKITPLAWSPLAAGRLCFPAPIDLNEPGHAKRIQLRDAIDVIARERNVSRGVVALAWLLKHPGGILPIIGSTDPRNIKAFAAATDLELSREEWYSLLEGANGERLP
ncbi:MAG TPA: aldo/keto reductase [Verrucomicrobiae bacterium]|jgi:predicted oxidoreductase|nr:aldo/keto reductase [Verrucomicrobiae bacterium]